MPYEFKLPDLGEGLTEGEIARWLVAEGDEIAEDAPLVEIATDKTTVEIPSPAAGLVSKIFVAEGDIVPVGTVLVVIGGDPGEPPVAPSAAPAGRVQATPLVRRVAQELGVDLESVTATGSGGRVTEDDVRAAAGGAGTRPVQGSEGRREKVRGVRRQIVEHLSRAHREVPAVTYVEECDFSNVDLKLLLPIVLRATAGALKEFPELNARLERDEIVYLDRYDLGIAVQTDAGLLVPVVRACDTRSVDELRTDVDMKQLLPTVLKATAESLKEFPELNARLEGDEIVYLDRYDLGIAVQTEQGLLVPVVRGCDSRSIDELRADIDALAEKARDGKLAAEELRGSTFTVTSAGKLAGLLVTPLVNHPEVGILGVHRIAPRPVVSNGEVVVRPMGNISTTFDHRVVDGARAAAFALDVIARLETG